MLTNLDCDCCKEIRLITLRAAGNSGNLTRGVTGRLTDCLSVPLSRPTGGSYVQLATRMASWIYDLFPCLAPRASMAAQYGEISVRTEYGCNIWQDDFFSLFCFQFNRKHLPVGATLRCKIRSKQT